MVVLFMVLKDDNINQTMLVPMDLRNLIPEDHPCYFIKNVVDLIDCSKANQEFRGKPGEFAYPRELLLRLILMSVFDGVLSSGEIERKTRTDIAYMYLAALEKPSYWTIARFKVDYSDLIDEAFKTTIKIAKENDLYLLHDVTYKDFAREHFLVENYAPGQTLTIYSFSKIFGMAGLRIGGVISSKPIIDAIKNAVINDLGVNIISQYGAIEGLKSKSEWFEEMRQTCFENQRLINEMIEPIEGVFLPVYPSDANMMVIDLSGAGINPKVMSNYLIEKKLFTREGEYTSEDFGDRYLRISFSIPTEEIKVFCEEFPKAVEALRTK